MAVTVLLSGAWWVPYWSHQASRAPDFLFPLWRHLNPGAWEAGMRSSTHLLIDGLAHDIKSRHLEGKRDMWGLSHYDDDNTVPNRQEM